MILHSRPRALQQSSQEVPENLSISLRLSCSVFNLAAYKCADRFQGLEILRQQFIVGNLNGKIGLQEMDHIEDPKGVDESAFQPVLACFEFLFLCKRKLLDDKFPNSFFYGLCRWHAFSSINCRVLRAFRTSIR